MRTGKRSTYNRTTGSRTARLYSRRTAQKLNRIYQNEQAQRIRKIRYDQTDLDDSCLKHPNRPGKQSSGRKKNNGNSRGTTVIVAALIVVVLVMVFVALSLMRSGNSGNIELAEETDPAKIAEMTTTTYEESEPPVIYGVIPIAVYTGHSVAYKDGVYVEDDTDPYPTLEVNNEDVDLSTPGTYIISYIARDKDGNITREFSTVTVLEGKDLVSDDVIYAMADKVLDSIITNDMSDAMKCLKVYEYLHAIGYVDEVHSEDWMQNAYWMLTLREGDCFCYYSAARLLLSRLGYEVMEVRNNNNYIHYWCLVSIDGGQEWWHFDATCWYWGEDGILCLVSDTYLSEFTRRHRTSDGRLIHAWDLTKYPATPAYDFWDDEDRDSIYDSGLIEREVTYAEEEYGNGFWDEQYYYDYNSDYNYEYEYETYGPGNDWDYDFSEEIAENAYDAVDDWQQYEDNIAEWGEYQDPPPGDPYGEEWLEEIDTE